MADMGDIVKVQSRDDCSQVVRVCVHVIAMPGLTGAAVASPIVSDHSVAARRDREELIFPCIAFSGHPWENITTGLRPVL
jgi:hypothetical protein